MSSLVLRIALSMVILIGLNEKPLAQSLDNLAGIEVQFYPTGIISGISVEWMLSQQSSIATRITYNKLDHKDLGVQESEKGGGPGLGLIFREYSKSPYDGFFGGFEMDLFYNSIDWVNNQGTIFEDSGKSEVWVLQPALQVGYTFSLGEQFIIRPHLSFGLEVNVSHTGKETGQGPILLIGFYAASRI